ncbi:MAG: hypothetical protein ABR498_08120 [Candidatus Dormibacteria bacterium]
MATVDRYARATRALGALLENGEGGKHPLTPAALRVERSSARGERGSAHQTALTVWFGQGPQLPVPGNGTPVRTVVGAVAGIAGAVALGALGFIASQREARHLVARAKVPRLTQQADNSQQ